MCTVQVVYICKLYTIVYSLIKYNNVKNFLNKFINIKELLIIDYWENVNLIISHWVFCS